VPAFGRPPRIWQCGAMSGRTGAQGFLVALARAVRFYSRLPVPRLAAERRAEEPFDFAIIAPAAPVAGLIIGAIAALALLLAFGLGLGTLAAAVIAVGCGVVITGAMHEDGLGDLADGVFVEAPPERRLEIMHDSRLGTFGMLALLIATLLRVAFIVQLSHPGIMAAATAVIGAAALSRGAGLMPLVLLRPARRDGVGAAAGRLPVDAFTNAVMLGCGLALVLALTGGFGLMRGLLACLVGLAAARGVCALAEARIGGQTGDVAGAAQILAEIGFYLALALGSGG